MFHIPSLAVVSAGVQTAHRRQKSSFSLGSLPALCSALVRPFSFCLRSQTKYASLFLVSTVQGPHLDLGWNIFHEKLGHYFKVEGGSFLDFFGDNGNGLEKFSATLIVNGHSIASCFHIEVLIFDTVWNCFFFALI